MIETYIEEKGEIKKEKVSVYDCLRKYFPSGEYALMAEVSDKAGFDRSRSADYMVMGLWPSRGLSLYGIEVKSYRGDWLSEKRNPAKAENIFKYCDNFWLLTTSEDIARIEEIPDTWGWMCIKGKKIIIKKHAPKLNPEPITRTFLAALLKRAECKTGFVHIDTLEETIEQQVEKRKDNAIKNAAFYEKYYKELKQKVDEFEKETGLCVTDRWSNDIKKMGKAIKMIMNGGVDEYKKELDRVEHLLGILHKRVSDEKQSLNELTNEQGKE